MQAIGGHRRPGQAPGQFGREEDVGQLRQSVDLHGPVALLGLEVVEVEAPARRGVGRRRDVHDPPLPARLDPIEQQLGEEEGTQVVHGEGGLEAVDRQSPLGQDDAGVVDQNVDVGAPFEDGGRSAADRGQRSQVEHHQVDPVAAAAGLDVGHGRLAAALVARRDHRVRSGPGQGDRRLRPDAGVPPRDDDGPPGHVGALHRPSLPRRGPRNGGEPTAHDLSSPGPPLYRDSARPGPPVLRRGTRFGGDDLTRGMPSWPCRPKWGPSI